MGLVRPLTRPLVRTLSRGVSGGVGVSLLSLATAYLNGVEPYHYFDFTTDRALYQGEDAGALSSIPGYSFSRASGGYYTNSDGTLEWFESGQLRMKRTAPDGHNLLTYSQDLTNAAWTKILSVAASAELSPDGTSTGVYRISGSSGNVFQSVLVVGFQYTASVWVKSNGAGQDEFKLRIGSSESSVKTATSEWVQHTYTAVADSAVAAIRTNSTGSTDILVWHPQFNEGSTAGTYKATTASPVYAPRKGDRGVLIEGARTNLLLRSQEFDNASWTKTAGSVTANAATAPDGTTTADLFTEDGIFGNHRVFQVVVSTAAAYTATAYVKPVGRTWFYLRQNDSGNVSRHAYFDCTGAGALGTLEPGVTATIKALADGWYRLTATIATSLAGSNSIVLGVTTADNTNAHTGNSSASAYFWQADYQLGAHASSPIVTTTASATRAADVLTYTVNSSAEIAAAVASETELVTNGGFDADASWTKGTDWTIAAGVASKTAGTAAFLSQPAALVAGTAYAVTYTATVSAGTIQAQFSTGSSVLGTARSASGTYTEILYAVASNDTVRFLANSAFVGTIDNVSVKAIPANSLTLYPLTLWAEFERAVDTGNDEYLLHAVNSGTERSFIAINSVDQALAQSAVTAGNAGVAITSGTAAVGSTHKIAGRIASNNVQVALNGTLGTSDTSADMPAAPTLLRIGAFDASLRQPFGYLRRAAIFNSALSDANLQTVTT